MREDVCYKAARACVKNENNILCFQICFLKILSNLFHYSSPKTNFKGIVKLNFQFFFMTDINFKHAFL